MYFLLVLKKMGDLEDKWNSRTRKRMRNHYKKKKKKSKKVTKVTTKAMLTKRMIMTMMKN